ncbi:hypothetical protein OA182_02390 [Candidatus Pelagibacter sp.]|nr:hypothetical protein [Candidatus Pelagibacter sp.]
MSLIPSAIYIQNLVRLNNLKFLDSIKYNMQAVGLKKQKKYIFKVNPNINDFIFAILNIIFLYFSNCENLILNISFIVSVIIFIFNQSVRNFADIQIVRGQIFMLAVIILILNFNIVSLIIFFITFSLINPAYFHLLNFKDFFSLEKEVQKFIKKIPKKNTVLFIKKKNSDKNLSNVFGNSRHYIDIFIYFFSKNKILFLPDFNTVFSDYNEKYLWGTSEKKISENLNKNKTKYFLIEVKNKNLPTSFKKKKYKIISYFNFKNKIGLITPKPFDNINLLLVKSI